MDRKRPAEAYIKPDPDLKRVKKEDGGDHFDLSSLPRAPPTTADYSSSTVVKTESNNDRKPLNQTSHNPARRPPKDAKSRQFGGQSLMIRRGPNWVRVHLKKRDMIVELAIHYGRGVPWDLGGVEKEIFDRLHRAYMFVEPVEKPGFLNDHITKIEENLDTLSWITFSMGKYFDCHVYPYFDDRRVSVKISENIYRDFVHFVPVRPFEGQGQSAVRTEDTRASQHLCGLDLKQPSLKLEEDIKTEQDSKIEEGIKIGEVMKVEEEKSNVLVSHR